MHLNYFKYHAVCACIKTPHAPSTHMHNFMFHVSAQQKLKTKSRWIEDLKNGYRCKCYVHFSIVFKSGNKKRASKGRQVYSFPQ